MCILLTNSSVLCAQATANWIMQTLAWEAQMVINEIVNAVTLVQSPPAEVIIGSDARCVLHASGQQTTTSQTSMASDP